MMSSNYCSCCRGVGIGIILAFPRAVRRPPPLTHRANAISFHSLSRLRSNRVTTDSAGSVSLLHHLGLSSSLRLVLRTARLLRAQTRSFRPRLKRPPMASTTGTLDENLVRDVKIAIIGGSGLYSLDNLKVVGQVYPHTPWGFPSDKITICATAAGTKIAFLPRHGVGHAWTPSQVPSRANIAALKRLGVQAIVAFSAVGSLREECAPRDFVLPHQIIDRTKGIRPATFFENGLVGHVAFADPFHAPLAELISRHAAGALQPAGGKLHRAKTLVCMEGPAFSTRAESHLYRSWGGDVINMSVLPEAKLAREAEIAYQMVCMVTDYDCWRETEEAVNVAMVMHTMEANKASAKRLVEAFLPPLEAAVTQGTLDGVDFLAGVRGCAAMAVMTAPEMVSQEAAERIKYILPYDFGARRE